MLGVTVRHEPRCGAGTGAGAPAPTIRVAWWNLQCMDDVAAEPGGVVGIIVDEGFVLLQKTPLSHGPRFLQDRFTCRRT